MPSRSTNQRSVILPFIDKGWKHSIEWMSDQSIYWINLWLFPQTPTALTFIKAAQIGEEEVSVVETHSTTPTCQLIVKNPVAYAKSA